MLTAEAMFAEWRDWVPFRGKVTDSKFYSCRLNLISYRAQDKGLLFLHIHSFGYQP